MKVGLIIGISIAVIVIILVIVYFVNKGKSAYAAAASVPSPSESSAPPPPGCTPYTQDQYKRSLQGLRAKCTPKLIIPIVGIGAYAKCMQEGKSKLPPIC